MHACHHKKLDIELADEKAETLRQAFFLWLTTADLLDIDEYEYLLALEFPTIMLLEIESSG